MRYRHVKIMVTWRDIGGSVLRLHFAAGTLYWYKYHIMLWYSVEYKTFFLCV